MAGDNELADTRAEALVRDGDGIAGPAESISGPRITAEDIAAAVAAKEAVWQSRPPLKRLGELDIMTAVLESALRPGGLVARAVAEERDRLAEDRQNFLEQLEHRSGLVDQLRAALVSERAKVETLTAEVQRWRAAHIAAALGGETP